MTDTAGLTAALQAASSQPWALQEERATSVAALLSDASAGLTVTEGALARALGPGKMAAADVRQIRTAGGKITAIVPIQGMILYDFDLPPFTTGMRQLAAAIRELAADDAVDRIILDIGSFGGTVTGVEEAAEAIFEARQRKPVIAAINPLAASAAYHLASQATEITITPSGDTGSIGVFAMHVDTSAALERAGIRVTFVKAGKFKTETNATEPLSDDARAHLQATVDAFHDKFIADIARGRGISAAMVRRTFGQGRLLLAQDALRVGMVDRIGTIEEVIAGRSASPASGRGAASGNSPSRTTLARRERLKRKLQLERLR